MKLGAEFLARFHQKDGYCFPDWESISELADRTVPEADWQALWEELGRYWLGRLRVNLGGAYRVIESDNFLILTAAPDRIVADAGRFYERALKAIHSDLHGVAAEQHHGKYEVILFEELDDYYSYVTHVCDRDEQPMSGGVFITSGGCSHFAFPVFDYSSYRSVMVHELTHGCLAHLELPRWIDEAVAMRMEGALGGREPLQLDAERAAQHRQFWNAGTIQQFWSGASWSVPGDSFGLSYDLAEILFHVIESDLRPDKAVLVDFIGTAQVGDGGEAACRRIFGLGVGDLAACFLGEGPWTPRPEGWTTHTTIEEERPPSEAPAQ